jgi:hypothetical protein
VTQLGEFSPIWAIVFFGQFFENYRRRINVFGYPSYNVHMYIEHMYNVYVFILKKTGLGNKFGAFFTNSSGHPGHRTENSVKSSPFQKSLQIHYLFCATCKTTTG